MATKSVYKIIKALGSTTLNEIYPSQSFHRDETIVVGKIISSSAIAGGPYRKRAALNFSQYNEEAGYDKAYLQVYEAKASSLTVGTVLEIGFNTASSDAAFTSGRGRRDALPVITEGSTWKYQNAATGNEWSEQTASVKLDYVITASADIDCDVSTLLTAVNEKDKFNLAHINLKSTFEDDAVIRGEIEYYSSQTHTVYEPTLVVASESVANCYTGKEAGDFSLESDYVVYHRNLRSSYYSGSITFKFAARTMFPSSTYGTASSAIGVDYLPSSSTYNFLDVSSNEFILPKSMQDNLAIESDKYGHYIERVPTNLFYPYRKYQLAIFVQQDDSAYRDVIIMPETFQVEAIHND